MNQIEREIYVTQKRLNVCFDITSGSDLLPIKLKVMDYLIPTNAIATAYALGTKKKLRKIVCSINENEILFTPSKGFFDEGPNSLQIRITCNSKDLVSFEIAVRCQKSIVNDNATEVEDDPSLTTQLLSEVGILSARLDEALSIPEGGTTADAALNDIKVGYDGTVYDTPGNAVREQVEEAHERINANSIISTAQGETILVTDSAKVPPENIKLFGKTTQVTTEGNQLFDADVLIGSKVCTKNGDNITVTISTTDDYLIGGYLVNGNTLFTLDANTYVVGCSDSNIRVTIYCVIDDIIYGIDTDKNGTTLANTASVVGIRIRSINGTDLKGKTFKIMLNAGNTLLRYEPYTGKKPSPSIDYPQPLDNVGAKGNIIGNILTSNLFDVNNAIKLNGISELIINNDSVTFTTTNNYNQYGMIYKNLSSGEYTFGYHSQKNNANASIELRAYYTDDGSELGAVIKETNLSNSITFNYDSSKGYLVIWTRPNATTTVTYTGIVFCKGSELKDYEPYSEQSFLASTPNGLPGLPLGQTILDEIKNSPIHMSGVYWDDATSQYYIGDTKDYAKGKNVQRILKIVLDGSTAYGFDNGGIWHLGSSAIQTISGGEIMSFADLHNGKNPSLSNYFITQSDSYGGVANEWEEYYNTMCVTGSAGSIAINAGMFPTADEAGFKAFFAAHPTEIYVIAKEPIIIDLTEEELAQYNALYMNYPNTTITNDSEAYTEVEYVASPKEYIANLEKKHDNDIQQLKTAIIALGGTI